jgi:hypothetical protein
MRTREATEALETNGSQNAGPNRHKVPDSQDGYAAQVHAAQIISGGNSTLSRASGSTLLHLQRSHGNRYVQRVVASAKNRGNEVTSDVESAIDRARSGGQALDQGVRSQMEAAFGADFGAVRVHTGPEAHALNRAVNATAFTTGPDIFFRDGSYDPSNTGGKELLAHELTHVVQQGGASVAAHMDAQATPLQRMCPACAEEEKKGPLQYKLDVSQPGDPYELEADRTAAAVMKTLGTASPGDRITGPQDFTAASSVAGNASAEFEAQTVQSTEATAGSEPAATEEEEKAAT